MIRGIIVDTKRKVVQVIGGKSIDDCYDFLLHTFAEENKETNNFKLIHVNYDAKNEE